MSLAVIAYLAVALLAVAITCGVATVKKNEDK